MAADPSPAGGDTDYEKHCDQEEDEEEEEVADNGTETNGHHIESNQKMLGQSSTIEPDEPAAVFPKSVSVKPSQGTTETAPAPAPPATVKQEPSFNFLQESQIDLESPHMDPAVVMVHPAKRPVQPPGKFGSKYLLRITWNSWPHLKRNALIDVEVDIKVKTDSRLREK